MNTSYHNFCHGDSGTSIEEGVVDCILGNEGGKDKEFRGRGV